ncbi:ATP-binding protein [Thermomonas brevis]
MTLLRALLLLLLACCGQALAQAPVPLVIPQAEAVRGGWNDAAPPTHGWQPVSLMDQWNKRWPDHDGVVWYRVRWQQADAARPVGLLVSYISMAGAVYVNGSQVRRDPSLVEPLSRAWAQPQYYLLDAPLLQSGDNELLVRVSGLGAYQPGFGAVTVGDPAAVESLYRAQKVVRFDLRILGAAIGMVMAAVFGLFWLLRRQDTTYGWYAAGGLFGGLYGYNWMATSPWPFASTDAWQALIAVCFFARITAFVMFLLRICERRWPRFERALLAVTGLLLVLAFVAPHWMGPNRNLYIVPAIVIGYLADLVFIGHALRHRRPDLLVLAVCLVLPVLASLHDLAAYMEWIRTPGYLGVVTAPLSVLGLGFVLAHRFATSMKRVEGFNLELQREVAAATGELAETLNRQHALELSHSRAGERLKLVRDLHDGFGGTLVGAIARLEQAPEATPKTELVAMLKDMRDDLRLVIDTTAQEHADLAALIAPLRHRATRLLDAADIDARWHLHGIDGLHMDPARSLDLLRLLQEALTNVFKHSGAQRVDVRVERDDGRIHVAVRDDGRGLPADPAAPRLQGGGAGFASMRLRAQRLGGELQIADAAPGTALELAFPLAS